MTNISCLPSVSRCIPTSAGWVFKMFPVDNLFAPYSSCREFRFYVFFQPEMSKILCATIFVLKKKTLLFSTIVLLKTSNNDFNQASNSIVTIKLAVR